MRSLPALVFGLICASTALSQGSKPAGGAARAKVPAANSAPAQVAWMVVHDTRENAFSIEVPKGWKVTGGAYRLGANNPRFLVDMTSPDGSTNLRVGDSAVPAFTVPGSGWAEGTRYSSGVDWAIVARYLSGRDFAVKYAQGRFQGMCQAMQLKRTDVLSPVVSPEREVIARTVQGELVNTTTAGQALFRCVANGQDLAAYVAAETTLTASNFSPIRNWAVTALVSFLAPRGQTPQALRMLLHSAGSFRVNPEWIRRQADISRRSTELVLKQTQQAVAAQQQRFERMDAERHRQFLEMDDLINGVQWTSDPATGRHHEAPLGPNPNYFYNPNTGVYVNSTFRPGDPFDWHELTPTRR
jgi:hypothetical protein